MDEAIARHLIRINFRCSRELQDLLMLLKAQLPKDEFDLHAQRIGMVLAQMGQSLSQVALDEYPALGQEVDASLSRYGEFI